MAFFSIIIPVYNVAKYVRECLDSVLSQTFTDWEAICIDDGSTDGSGAILDEYAVRDARFRVIHQSNAGVSVTRERALCMCNGKWLISIDPDDWVEKDFLQWFRDSISDDVEMLWCDYIVHSKGTDTRINTRGENNSHAHLIAILGKQLMGTLCNKAIRISSVAMYDIHFPPKGADVMEDLSFLCKFLSFNPQIRWVDACGYHYRIHDNSALHKKNLDLKPVILAEEDIQQAVAKAVPKSVLYPRRRHLKFRAYADESVTDLMFDNLFPEIRDICGENVAWWHKILFRISVLGGRRWVVAFLACVRKFALRRHI